MDLVKTEAKVAKDVFSEFVRTETERRRRNKVTTICHSQDVECSHNGGRYS